MLRRVATERPARWLLAIKLVARRCLTETTLDAADYQQHPTGKSYSIAYKYVPADR